MAKKRGFTLIELLVVIAIIALLISILLPALKNARAAAQLAISLSNVRQINAASISYQNDNREFYPLVLNWPGRATNGTNPLGWCTWSYGGKNTSGFWANSQGGAFDVLAADRPLNPYVYQDGDFDAPPPPARLTAAAPQRTTLQLQVFRSPLDRVGHQRSWPNPNVGRETSYDDVGTSYHFNVKWWLQRPAGSFQSQFDWGARQLRIASQMDPARLVWLMDEVADVVTNNTNTNFRFVNTIGDVNRSVMGFADGHAGYHTVFPGTDISRFSTHQYTLWFSHLFR